MQRLRASAWKTAVAAALALMLAACSSDTDEEAYEEQPVDSIYNAAMELLLDRNYTAAAKQFEEVERQHPYSIWAAKAQVMSAYAYFRRDRYDEAVNAADRFIQLHPTSPDAPYAYYLKSLAYYEQIVDVGRDQRTTGEALDALEEVVRRFPETQYARDASLKLDLTRDHLAGKEMAVGRFYLKRGELAAAINRFKRVIEQHQTTSHVPEALLRLSEAYTALGLTNEARRMTAILGHNYPGSPWYADAYELVEDTEVADFPRPDERAFYERWLDPDTTIARAERRDVPELAPGAASPRTEVAAAAPAGPSRAVIGAPLEPDPPVIETVQTAAAPTPTEADAKPDLPSGKTVETPEADSGGGFFSGIASAVTSLVTSSDDDPAPAPPQETVAQAPAEPTPGEARAVERAPIAAADAAPLTAVTAATEEAPEPTAATADLKPWNLSAGERAALAAEAESQTLAAREAAGEWRRAVAQASSDDGRRRAKANVALSEAAAGYWAARGAVAQATTDEQVRGAELKLAEESVAYWTAARDAAEDGLSRQHAGEALARAEEVLAYWRANDRRPSWLERTFGSAI